MFTHRRSRSNIIEVCRHVLIGNETNSNMIISPLRQQSWRNKLAGESSLAYKALSKASWKHQLQILSTQHLPNRPLRSTIDFCLLHSYTSYIVTSPRAQQSHDTHISHAPQLRPTSRFSHSISCRSARANLRNRRFHSDSLRRILQHNRLLRPCYPSCQYLSPTILFQLLGREQWVHQRSKGRFVCGIPTRGLQE